MGETNFLIALYNAKTELVEIPYMAEGQQTVSIPSFPLGQGLTSIVIRTQQPLMIVEDTISRSRALGAIVTSDHPARSWLGVPMIVGGEVVGAVVVQDTDREYRFDDDDLRLLTTLAGQVAPTIRNARLLSEAQETAERDRRLYEVTDKIRQATSIQSILEITTQELSKILNLKTAKIEISVDPTTLSKRDNGSEEKPE
jgi:GAF domain-containing protein